MALQGVILHLTAPGLQHLLCVSLLLKSLKTSSCVLDAFFLKKVSSTVSVFSVILDYISVKSKKQM